MAIKIARQMFSNFLALRVCGQKHYILLWQEVDICTCHLLYRQDQSPAMPKNYIHTKKRRLIFCHNICPDFNKSNCKSKYRYNTVNRLVLPANAAASISRIVPKARACSMQTSAIFLHNYTSNCKRIRNWCSPQYYHSQHSQGSFLFTALGGSFPPLGVDSGGSAFGSLRTRYFLF